MKTTTMIAVALAAACSLAMPTNKEIEKAGTEVHARLQKQLIKWLDGQMSDSELANLLLMMADKEKEEARHYVCLQGALAAYARAGDADAAVKTLKRLRAETKDFTPAIERAVVKKVVAKASDKVASAIRSTQAAPVGEYRDEHFGRIDAMSAEVLRRMKSTTLPKMTFETDSKPGQAATWILEQVAQLDGGETIAYTLHGVPEKMVHPVYASSITCYEALTFLFNACGCDNAQIFIKDGRVHIWFDGGVMICKYEVVHDETAERIFGEIEEDGLPKCLSFYSDGNGKPPSRHWFRCQTKFSYEKHGARGILEVGTFADESCRIMPRLVKEGLKFNLLTREIFSLDEVKSEGWKLIERLDDKQLELKKEQEEELKRLREELEKRRKERMTRRLSLQRPSSQAPQNKKDDAGKARNDGSANQGKIGK